ncbi:DUF3999 family protein [Paracidovorax sp. MALMAid1276]|uniref:DUF3999 family protein n=1 Tax=Paracidovorax sp. MALMAid1276 TaxID=3411631 RepID=UPI003B9B9150
MKSTPCPWRALVGAALVAALCSATGLARAAADAAHPDAYAIRIPVTPTADAPLQRLVLPAEVLVRLQSPGLADLRLFNGAGQPVPMALASVASARAPHDTVALPAYPILGAVGTAGPSALEGLSLRIEERQGQRVVQIESPAAAGSAAAQAVQGALLDARGVQQPVVRMALDADLPPGQPVTLRVHASTDLQHWRPLAETVLYRAEAAGPTASAAAAGAVPGRLGNEQIDLHRADLKGHYLRVTWGPAAVTLRGATLATTRGPAVRERTSARMAVPAPGGNPRELVLALPFATPVAALVITPPGSGNVLIPVRVLGRTHREQPWQLLASAVVYRMASGGTEQVSPAVELGGASVRELKIEVDAKAPGFAVAPGVTLQFEPAQLVFLASGPGPFTLAAGLPGAGAGASAFLPLASLVPGYQPGHEDTLPLALADVGRADIPAGPPADGAVVPAAAGGGGLVTRTAVLWGVLLAGVAALALMAWLLVRQTRAAGPQVPPAPDEIA